MQIRNSHKFGSLADYRNAQASAFFQRHATEIRAEHYARKLEQELADLAKEQAQ